MMLLGFICVIALHTVLGFMLCGSLPYSRYRDFCYGYGMRHDLAVSQQRSKEALDYMVSVNEEATKLRVSKLLAARASVDRIEFCVAIVSVMRPLLSNEEQYVFQLLKQILPEVLSDSNVSLHIVNGERIAENHTALKKYASFVPTRHIAPSVNSKGVTEDSSYIKEKYDYGMALRACESQNPHYVLLLQDDVIPHHRFISTLRYLIRNRLPACGGPGKSWAYARLFYPERWSGFQDNDFPAILAVSLCLGAGLLLLVYFILLKLVHAPFGLSRFPWLLLLPSCFLVLSLLYMVNRFHLEELRFLSDRLLVTSSPADRCCIPAVLYQQSGVRALSDFLVQSANNGEAPVEVDLAIAEFAASKNWTTCRSFPNVVDHHGRQSTLPKPMMEDVT